MTSASTRQGPLIIVPPPHSRLLDLADELDFWRPDRDTGQFSAERIMAATLRQHPCHTDDPDLASAYVVPALTDIARLLTFIGPRDDRARLRRWRAYPARVVDWLLVKHRTRVEEDLWLTHHFSAFPVFAAARFGPQAVNYGPEVPEFRNDRGQWALDKMRRAMRDVVMPYVSCAGTVHAAMRNSYPDLLSQEIMTPDFFARTPRDKLVIFHGSTLPHMHIRVRVREHLLRHPELVLYDETTDRWSIGAGDHAVSVTHAERSQAKLRGSQREASLA
jgi:hypothetical protein